MIKNFFFSQSRIKSPKFVFQAMILMLIINFVTNSGTSYCFEINRLFDDCQLGLTYKIDLTLDLALKKYDGQKIWLIYSIDCFSCFDSLLEYQEIQPENSNLTELIHGKFHHQNKNQKKYTNYPPNNKFSQTWSENKLERLVDKDDSQRLAIILDFSLESGNPCLYNVYVQNMNQAFVKEKRPVFWLGAAIPSASIGWLSSQFNMTDYQKLRHQIITVIGAHYSTQLVVEFLKQVIFSNYSISLKIDAIHSLGKHNSIESIRLLTYLAVKSNNPLLRKKAIFALSQLNEKTAKNVVTTLASKAKNREVRQEAIFWLSQIADDEVPKVLNNILANEQNATIKRYTLFAISQLPENKSIPILSHISRNNPDIYIRNKAKFWLNRTKENRIMDFMEELNNCEGSNQLRE